MKVTLKVIFEQIQGFDYVDFVTSENVVAFTSKEPSLSLLKEVALDACWKLNEAGFFTFVNPEQEVIEISVECRDLNPQMLITYIYDHIYHNFV
jgi:hypothetical protein